MFPTHTWWEVCVHPCCKRVHSFFSRFLSYSASVVTMWHSIWETLYQKSLPRLTLGNATTQAQYDGVISYHNRRCHGFFRCVHLHRQSNPSKSIKTWTLATLSCDTHPHQWDHSHKDHIIDQPQGITTYINVDYLLFTLCQFNQGRLLSRLHPFKAILSQPIKNASKYQTPSLFFMAELKVHKGILGRIDASFKGLTQHRSKEPFTCFPLQFLKHMQYEMHVVVYPSACRFLFFVIYTTQTLVQIHLKSDISLLPHFARFTQH